MFIYAAAMFVLVTCASVVLLNWLGSNKSQLRLRGLAQPKEKKDWTKTAVDFAGPLSRLSIPEGKWEDSPLRIKFLNAGIRSAQAPVIFYAGKTVLPLLFAATGYAALGFAGQAPDRNVLTFLLLLCATLGCYFPNIVLSRMIKTRKRELVENFPDATDLLLVCVEAGLGLDAAMVRVAEEMKINSMALTEELHLTNLEARAGSTRQQALRNLGLRTGLEEIHSFISMLTQADKFGTSIGASLRVFSDDLRYRRQMRAEVLAAKLPTKMLFPLVLCIFPAISMVILGPAGVKVYRVLFPLLSGQHM